MEYNIYILTQYEYNSSTQFVKALKLKLLIQYTIPFMQMC